MRWLRCGVLCPQGMEQKGLGSEERSVSGSQFAAAPRSQEEHMYLTLLFAGVCVLMLVASLSRPDPGLTLNRQTHHRCGTRLGGTQINVAFCSCCIVFLPRRCMAKSEERKARIEREAEEEFLRKMPKQTRHGVLLRQRVGQVRIYMLFDSRPACSAVYLCAAV